MNNTNLSVLKRHLKVAPIYQSFRVIGPMSKGSRALLALLALAALSACGGGKIISTVDNSADYKSAKSRPPLKKPSTVTAKATPKAEVAPRAEVTPVPESLALESTDGAVAVSAPEATDSIDEVSDAESVEATVVDSGAREQAYVPERAEPAVKADIEAETAPRLGGGEDLAGAGDTGDAQPDDQSEREDDKEFQKVSTLNARVISPKKDVSRLQVEADFSDAWLYLSRSLQKSDVTVFSRNKAAGRFSIGCSGIDEAPTVKKKGGWSFLNKRQKPEQEYCALQAVATKGVTVVRVLNRFSEEVDSENAGDIFTRLLNN